MMIAIVYTLVLELVLNKILLLEDDPVLAKTLQKFLQKDGYEVDWVKDGEEASRYSYENDYSLYLFDINVPLFNGDDLLKELRDSGDNTPCILVTALVDIDSVTKGFVSGADDYIKKPFDPNELLVRIKAKTKELKKHIMYKNYTLVMDDDSILYKNKEFHLPNIQQNIFVALIKNHPNPVTKDELMLFLETPNDLALRVNMAKLKQKLDVEIKNMRGIGYKLA